jgi:hypothetical protein
MVDNHECDGDGCQLTIFADWPNGCQLTIFADWPNAFAVVDRVGMSIALLLTFLAAANVRPAPAVCTRGGMPGRVCSCRTAARYLEVK